MTPDTMTLDRLATFGAVADLVGRRPSKRWRKASQVVRRSDGISIFGWFTAHDAGERIRLVGEAVRAAAPWSPLLRVEVPKRPGSAETRPIDMPTVPDTARLYLIHDWLQRVAEAALTPVAVAFRPGRSFSDTVLGAQKVLKERPFAAVIDIKAFFNSAKWRLLDAVIGRLPAEERLKGLLRALVRAEVVERRSGVLVQRWAGIPQGLSVSPVLANLILAPFDRAVAKVIGKVGARIWRYCDDILVVAKTLAGLELALQVVRDRLAQLGLEVKDGTGQIVNTRETPVLWLGLAFTPADIDVPASVVQRKTSEIQDRHDQGILSAEGVDDSLIHRHKHYSRILGSDRADSLDATIRGGLHFGAHPTRKEGIERLRELVTER